MSCVKLLVITSLLSVDDWLFNMGIVACVTAVLVDIIDTNQTGTAIYPALTAAVFITMAYAVEAVNNNKMQKKQP